MFACVHVRARVCALHQGPVSMCITICKEIITDTYGIFNNLFLWTQAFAVQADFTIQVNMSVTLKLAVYISVWAWTFPTLSFDAEVQGITEADEDEGSKTRRGTPKWHLLQPEPHKALQFLLGCLTLLPSACLLWHTLYRVNRRRVQYKDSEKGLIHYCTGDRLSSFNNWLP